MMLKEAAGKNQTVNFRAWAKGVGVVVFIFIARGKFGQDPFSVAQEIIGTGKN